MCLPECSINDSTLDNLSSFHQIAYQDGDAHNTHAGQNATSKNFSINLLLDNYRNNK